MRIIKINHRFLSIKTYLFVSLFLFCSATVFAQTPINYPIEVFRVRNTVGNSWQSTSDIITVNLKNYTGIDAHLYLKVNNLNKENALYYRVDGGTGWSGWQICNAKFDQFPKDNAYGGIGGGFGTVEFTTPVTGFTPNAQNNIQFTFFYTAGDDESGYRILDMELWEGNGANETNQMTNGRADEDPSLWVGPFGSGNSLRAAEGADLWFGRNGAPNLINAAGSPILASCSNCHAHSGYDLKYFNYSNASIESRSTFHGLTREEGRKIAQYIRDLPYAGSAKGRPWQPPYQPGPNTDSDGFEWAAGAGLENVLPNEDGLLEDVFGSLNPSKSEIRDAINKYEDNTNIREQRIATQFPDWNEWLPEVHPKDILNSADYSLLENAFITLRNSIDTQAERDALNNKSGVRAIYNNNGIFEAFGVFATEVHKVVDDPGSGLTVGNYPVSPIWADNSSTQSREELKRSLSAWYSVKLFDVIQEYNLHDISDLGNILNSNEETFQWPTREWAVFQNAAHIISGNRATSFFLSDAGDATKETESIYLSSLWYQVQLTLTPGHRKGGVVSPNDFAYNLQHIHRLAERTGVSEPVRLFQNYLKTAEQRNNGLKPGITASVAGWNMRELSPWRLWSTGRGVTDVFDALLPNLKKDLRDIFMSETADVLLSFLEADWARVDIVACPRTDFELEFRNTIPIDGSSYEGGISNCMFYDRRCGGGCEDANDAVEIDAIYTLLNVLDSNEAITEGTFNKLRDWAIARWDYTQWPNYDTSARVSSTVGLDVIENKVVLNLYPNPVQQTLHISGLSSEIKQVQLIDVYGREFMFNQTKGEVDVSELSTGLYILSIENHVFRVIKE